MKKTDKRLRPKLGRSQNPQYRYWLANLRVRMGMTQDMVANAIYIAPAYYREIERGEKKGSPDIRAALERVLYFGPEMWEDMASYKLGPRPIDYAAEARDGGRTWLLRIRLARGLTQREAALKAYMSTTYYSLIELGVYNGSETVRENIAKALEFPYRMWEVNG